MRVLIAEDDVTIQKGIETALRGAGHSASVASDGAHADLLLKTESFDLLVLDLGLPKLDGIAVLKRLRSRKQTLPVLILSARDTTPERIEGLDSGADDYMTKPFDLSEFDARVRALLRRSHGHEFEVGRLKWDWDNRQASVGGSLLDLSAHEVNLIETLLRSFGKTVTKASLGSLLAKDKEVDADNLIEVYVHRLRKKLADSGVEIRTIRGLGYRLQGASGD